MLNEWVSQCCEVLGLPPESVDVSAILDLARDAAHGVARPSAPLTAYLVGVAVGRGRASEEAITAVRALIEAWPARVEP